MDLNTHPTTVESLDENYKEIQGQPHQTRLGLVVKIQEIQGAAWINFTLIGHKIAL